MGNLADDGYVYTDETIPTPPESGVAIARDPRDDWPLERIILRTIACRRISMYLRGQRLERGDGDK